MTFPFYRLVRSGGAAYDDLGNSNAYRNSENGGFFPAHCGEAAREHSNSGQEVHEIKGT